MRIILGICFFAFIAFNASANTYTVTSTTDHPITGAGISVNPTTGVITGGTGNGLVTIRSAIAAANGQPGPHTINIPAGTFNLTIAGTGETIAPAIIGIGDLDVTVNNVTIHGAGMNSTIINQTSGIDRVFDVNVNFIANFNFTIDNLTISGGREQTGNGGGGMFTGSSNNLGTVSLTNVKFDNNQSFQASGFLGSGFGGGGLQHQGGDLVLSGCVFNNNSATKSGGALSACGFRDLPIALPLVNNTMTVTNCTFTNNTCNGASGGGAIDFFAMNLSSSTVTVTGCSFSGNTSTASSGGAIVNESTDLTVTKSTFLNNQALNGGAVYGAGGSTNVSFCRLIGNNATNNGDGFSAPGSSEVFIGNNNWWGVNTEPTIAVANTGGVRMPITKWLQLKITANPTSLVVSPPGSSLLTASFLTNNLNEAISTSNLTQIIGLPITFNNAIQGSLSAAQTTIQSSGTATATYTVFGTACPPTGSADATVDNATVTATITVIDNIPPTVSCPSNKTVSNDLHVCGASVALDAIATDNCPGAFVNYKIGATTITSPHFFPVGTTTVTAQAEDASGNLSIATCSFTVTVNDTQAPAISNAGANATIECTATPSFTAPTASDNCVGVTVNELTSTTTGNSCVRVYTKTWDAIDTHDNHSVTRTQIITVVDTQAPVIGSAGANATIECTLTPSFTAPTASDACNTYTVVQVGSDVTGGNSCAKTTTRTWRAIDACGNSSVTRNQIITQVDTQAPVIGAAGDNVTVECTLAPPFIAPTASDACNTFTVVQVGTDVTGGNSCTKTITRTWRAIDACGNSSGTRSQTVTQVDTQSPSIGSAGANATIECTATPSFTAPTASDACNTFTVVQIGGDVTGGNSCLKTTTRTWLAVDACGNSSATRSQTVTQIDSQAPIIGAAGSNTTIECTATPSFTEPTASDACNTYSVVQVGGDVTGGNSCIKTTTRTWLAVDACGNSSVTRSQTVTQSDTQAPAIGSAGDNVTIECTATPSFTAPTASDACNTFTVVQVGGDQTSGSATVNTITRTWRAIDACGNSSVTRSQSITRIDADPPTIGDAGANTTIECGTTPPFVQPTASDACSTANVVQVGSDVTGGTSCTKTITRTWRAIDANGNSSVTRSQTITQVDTQAPTIGAAGAATTIECTATPSFTAPTASDACNTFTVVQVGSDVSGGNSCVRTTTRTWLAVDACGNSSATRSQTITQSDSQAPVIGAAGSNTTIECTATPSFTEPTASDACNTFTIVQVGGDVTGGNSCAKTTTRTWLAIDACGNSSITRAQTVTQVDTQAPAIGSAGANTTIECTATPSFTAPTASDACNTFTVVQVGGDVTSGTSCSKTTTRTWRAIDACGNSSVTRSQIVTQLDTQAPEIGDAGSNATIECTATPSFTAPTASDACNTFTIVQVGAEVTGGNSCVKTTTTTWLAVDACGNSSATRSQTITQVDTQAPAIGAAGGNSTIECTATPSFTAPTATDVCNTYTVVQVGGDVTSGNSCVKTTTRTWRAVDACGNSSVTRSQTITQVDTQSPIIGSAGANTTVECLTTPVFNPPTASDACNTYTIVQVGSDVTGGTLTARTITRTWRAVDACGNSSTTRSQTITQTDAESPTVSSIVATPSVLWPPDHTMRDVVLTYTATDNCGCTPVVTITSNESTHGTADHDQSPDWEIIDATHIKLRSERGNGRDARVYTIRVTCTDASGNTTFKETEVRVAHNITSPTSGSSFKIGSTVSFSGVFWDKPGNKHTAQWLIDGSSVKATVTEPAGTKNGKVTGSYKFNTTGVYKLQMNVIDQSKITSYSNTNEDIEAIVVVYDPNGGNTYGGGWFSSQPGALVSDPTATGKASYGFAVNYFRTATYPKGETQFEFKVGDLEFNALNFEYLVIQGAKAQFRGTGKITGDQSGYAFIMTVTDGELDGSGFDKIRMKIFNKNTNEVIYDNQPGASDADNPVTTVGDNSNVVISGTGNNLKTVPQLETSETLVQLDAKAIPNPSNKTFTVFVKSNNRVDPIQIQVVDMYGRIVESTKVYADQIIRIGENYRPGTYVVKLVQANVIRQLKLVKLPE